MTDHMGDPEMAESRVSRGHNITAMHNAIREAFPKILAKEREIAMLEETHISDVKADKRFLWNDLKTNTGFARKYMEALYKTYKLQEEAKEFDDDDEREAAMDALRVTFESMAGGGQLDFVDALADTPLGGTQH